MSFARNEVFVCVTGVIISDEDFERKIEDRLKQCHPHYVIKSLFYSCPTPGIKSVLIHLEDINEKV